MSSANPRKYRAKPAEVEAIRYWPGENCEPAHALIGAEHDEDTCYAGAELVIFTDRGSETVKPGDWIVRDSSGDVHRCLDSTFAEIFELAEPESDCKCAACVANSAAEAGEPFWWGASMMHVCPDCGDKRCPQATSHEYECAETKDVHQGQK